MTRNIERVAVLGASTKPDRYSYLAVEALMSHGHRVFPVSPTGEAVLGNPGYRSLRDIPEPLDTVTLYVNPQRLMSLLDDLLVSPPRRVIFNPGTESKEAWEKLEAAGVFCQQACTLVLLSTGQYDQPQSEE